MVDEVLKKDGKEAALEALGAFMDRMMDGSKMIPFHMTESFVRVFGRTGETFEDDRSLPVTDLDMILPNVLAAPDGTWTLIDYEWTVSFPVPVDFVRYRILHYYLAQGGVRKALRERETMERFGITERRENGFRMMESRLQSRINEDHVPLVTMFGRMSPGVVDGRAAVGDTGTVSEPDGTASAPLPSWTKTCAGHDEDEKERAIDLLRAEIDRLKSSYDELLDLYEASQNEIVKLKQERRK